MPICNTTTNTCHACKSDAECPADPGVCLDDGHCATKGEVVFVEAIAGGCAGADGSSAKPYCLPNDGVAALNGDRRVIVLKGAFNGPMTMATGVLSPVVVGRKGAGDDVGSILAGTAVALRISSDSVLVRDLSLVGGGSVDAKGLVVAGPLTKVSLRRVTVALTTGLGISAEAGASLTMDRSVVQNNSRGGVAINGASYNIQNSVIAGNGLSGLRFSSTAIAAGSKFSFNTVIAATGIIAVSCDPNNAQSVTNSIIVGDVESCTPTDSVTAKPTFSDAKPFHLTAHLPCPAAPATFPAYDLDGDPRVAPTIDCGADRYVP
jgi:hypothetical protein